MGITAPERLCKQPSEKRRFSIEFKSLLDISSSEQISSITTLSSEKIDGSLSDLTLTLANIADGVGTNTRVTFWIEGGTTGNQYRIELLVVSDGGQELEGDGILEVKDK